MIIKNGLVFGEDKHFEKKDLYLNKGRIADAPGDAASEEVIDAEGLYVLPGLIDIHSHGAVGCDFSDADVEGLKKILAYERAHGITSYCPTSMTLPKEQLFKIFDSAAEILKAEQAFDSSQDAGENVSSSGTSEAKQARGYGQSKPASSGPLAHIAGFNMEGPFLDPAKKGAHVEEYILDPDVTFFRECNERAKGNIRLVTLAPNMPNSIDFIRELHGETMISLGHTSADYDTAKEAIATGANHVTHLYNAMMPIAHRAPGLICAAAEAPQCMAEIICDGIHIHQSVIRATFHMFPDRMILISDSMRATGMPNGAYELGGQKVNVNGRLATLDNGTIAGSATNLYDCMRTAVSFGISLEDAIAAATMNPAKSIGIYDKVGSLTPGKRADVLLVDKDLNLVRVI